MNTNRSKLVATAVSLAALLAACGGDDDAESAVDPVPESSVAEPTDEPDDSDDASSATPDGPVSTVSPEVPDEFLVAVGPMDIDGDDLPRLETDDIDADAAVGMAAPTIIGLDFDGNPVRVDAGQDGPTMVVFLAHWCPHCNDEIPVLNQLRDDGRFPDGLNIVAISTAADPSAPNFPPGEWLDEKDWTYPAIADGVDVESGVFIGAEAMGVSGFPFVVLIDGDGNAAARWSGEQDPEVTIQTIEERLDL